MSALACDDEVEACALVLLQGRKFGTFSTPRAASKCDAFAVGVEAVIANHL